jgi:hypothetical protein
VNIKMLLSGFAVLVVSCAAQGEFDLCCVDFGGPWAGVNGSPLVPVGGSILSQDNTSPSLHVELNAQFGGADGWGTTVGGIDDEAPAGIPGDPRLGTFVADPLLGMVPPNGIGGADSDFFGGYYGGNEVDAAYAAVIHAADNDVWVARIRLTQGATLATSGPVYIVIRGIDDQEESVLGIDETGVVSITTDHREENFGFKLEYRKVANLFADGSVVYDVFVVGGLAVRGVPEHDLAGGMPDFDGDGEPDSDDLRVLFLSYGECDSDCLMDYDGDRFIDEEDLKAWLDLYATSGSLEKSEKKAVRRLRKIAKKASKMSGQIDKKQVKADRLQDQLAGVLTSTMRWYKLKGKISKFGLSIEKMQSKIEDIIESAASRM